MTPRTSDEIRKAFLEFFEELGHEVVQSSPLPQYSNPTLLFTNAGMNQFADVFLGREKRSYVRATSSQKCMRVQGKHNDLENVGPSPRHHTFFEMLGNFSFGDYFKKGAIQFAFEFMTRVCQIPTERLWYTVHDEDTEAYEIWVKQVGVPADRVLRMGDKTNFWMMGDIGPCGPTSEIHYDWGPEYCTCGLEDCGVQLDNDCERWLEVWNLVFMQFNQTEDGTRTPLPRPGVDTGMGLERIASIVQQTPVNYDNDLFKPAMDEIQELLGDSNANRQEKYVGYRVIADHGRAATFLLADGVLPGNVGAGYVLRMIIRRAARYGRKIGFDRPFLAEVGDVYIRQMGEEYSELRLRKEHILATLTLEEERFNRTLDAALGRLAEVIADVSAGDARVISGESAFDLYATHGLPLEITRDVAHEAGLTVDEPGFNKARETHAAASGAGAFGQYDVGEAVYADLLEHLVNEGKLPASGVHYDPYSGVSMTSEIVALLRGNERVEHTGAGTRVEIVTAGTPFYGEAGGEVSDTGQMTTDGGEIRVVDVIMPVPGLVLHAVDVVRGGIRVGQKALLKVDEERRQDIRRNHTATHVLHRELRAHLGKHVLQAGSLVAPDRLRFDFTHGQAVGKEVLRAIEADINEVILANYPVTVQFSKQKEAIEAGAMALFGEKYGDTVRTIRIGSAEANPPYSYELCGGLHVRETAEIGLFRFVSEGAVAAGVRRVEAVTGRAARELVTERLDMVERIAGLLDSPVAELDERVQALVSDHKGLQRQVARLRRRLARAQFESLLAGADEIAGIKVLAVAVEEADADGLREMADWFRDRVKAGVAVFGVVNDGRPTMVATATDEAISRGIDAASLVRAAAKIIGGGGGGKANLAQAGGRDADKLSEALAMIPGWVSSTLRKK